MATGLPGELETDTPVAKAERIEKLQSCNPEILETCPPWLLPRVERAPGPHSPIATPPWRLPGRCMLGDTSNSNGNNAAASRHHNSQAITEARLFVGRLRIPDGSAPANWYLATYTQHVISFASFTTCAWTSIYNGNWEWSMRHCWLSPNTTHRFRV